MKEMCRGTESHKSSLTSMLSTDSGRNELQEPATGFPPPAPEGVQNNEDKSHTASPDGIVLLPRPPRPKDSTLDFFSMQFDALKALRTADVKRPNELVAALNNLSQCRFILPAEMKESLVHLQQLSTKTKVTYALKIYCSGLGNLFSAFSHQLFRTAQQSCG